MRELPKSCEYNWSQIKEAGLLAPERQAVIEVQLQEKPQPALKPDGSAIKDVLIIPSSRGESAFIVETAHSRDYMLRCLLYVLLTDVELREIEAHGVTARSRNLAQTRYTAAKEKGKLRLASEWDEGVFHGDTYYSSIEDLYESLESDPEQRPRFVYGATSRQVIPERLSAEDLLDNIIEENGWEDMDISDLEGVTELQSAISAFAQANQGVCSFWEDSSIVIELDNFPTESD